MIKKKNIQINFYVFLFIHLLIWTLIPSITNLNLPLDTIEALAWGSNLDWGFNKHPPLSAFFVELFYQIFGNQDWSYYLLSQIFIIFSFFIVWKFSQDFFSNKFHSLISVLLLEAIVFHNYSTPEFNVYICQLPFKALAVYFCWKSIKEGNYLNWILFGFSSALGFLSHYLFIFLLFAFVIFFIKTIYDEKKINFKYLIPLIVFLIVISPHIIWLLSNNFASIDYGISRTNFKEFSINDNFTNPIYFILKQLGLLIPFFVVFLLLIKKFKIKINFKDKKLMFLFIINILPLLLVFLTSFLAGIKIRTMWMSSFYLFFGVLVVYLFQKQIDLLRFKSFLISFLVLFLLYPAAYLYVSISKTDKRTDYPGSEIAYLVQEKWDKNFSNEIKLVIGDEWFGGNLSYHLISRPTWIDSLDSRLDQVQISGGVVYVGNPSVLKKICPGIYGTIKPVGICMIGSK
jgi:4-amino-4-deoxy-L-arabinose transferase-like glycosyltransferase